MKGDKGSYVAVAADEAENSAEAQNTRRRWHGGLLNCCGSFDQFGVGSYLLATHLPCLAWGWNLKRGLRQSAWLHSVLFVLLFILAAWASLAALSVANHNVLSQCNGPLPHPPHGNREDRSLRGPHESWGLEPELHNINTVTTHGKHERQLGEDQVPVAHSHNYKQDHSHEDDSSPAVPREAHQHEHKKKGCKGKGSKAARPSTMSLPQWASESSFRSAGSFAMPSRGPAQDPSPGCVRAMFWSLGAWVLVIASGLIAVHYAATRRTQIRQQFGIAGSKVGDWCAWFWCGPCALCQESRTLWRNNVEGGVWYGPTQLLPASAVQQPPTTQLMTTGTQAGAC